jgi:hypothetical protein
MEHGPAVHGNYNRPSGETWRGECLRPPPFSSHPPKVPLSHCPAALVRSPVSQACIESRKEGIWGWIINVTYVRITIFPVRALSDAYPHVSIVNGEGTISFIPVLRPSISSERGRDVSYTTPYVVGDFIHIHSAYGIDSRPWFEIPRILPGILAIPRRPDHLFGFVERIPLSPLQATTSANSDIRAYSPPMGWVEINGCFCIRTMFGAFAKSCFYPRRRFCSKVEIQHSDFV